MYGHGLAISALLLFISFLGTIETPVRHGKYPPGIWCWWKFEAQGKAVVSLRWTRFDLEGANSDGRCFRDYVLVLVEDNRNVVHMSARYCGKEQPQDVETLQQRVEVTFVSSTDEVQATGAAFDYEFLDESQVAIRPSMLPNYHPTNDRCGIHPQMLAAANAYGGELVSPGYPSGYEKGIDCAWLIRVQPKSKIYVQIVDLNLGENLGDCDKAELLILDGYAHTQNPLEKDQHVSLCGEIGYLATSGDKSFLSEKNRVLIRFKTREPPSRTLVDQYRKTKRKIGFFITWTEVLNSFESNETCHGFLCRGDDQCVDKGKKICAVRTQYCIPKQVVCDGIKNCGEKDNSDEEHCNTFQVVVISLSLVGVLLILMICICCHRYFWILRAAKRRRRRNGSNRSGDETGAGCEPRTNHHHPHQDDDGRIARKLESVKRADTFSDPCTSSMTTTLPHIHARVREEDMTVKEPFLAENHVPPSAARGSHGQPQLLPVYAQVTADLRRRPPQPPARGPAKPYPSEIRHLANQKQAAAEMPPREPSYTRNPAGNPSFVSDISDRHNLISHVGTGPRRGTRAPPEYPGNQPQPGPTTGAMVDAGLMEMTTFNPRPILKKSPHVIYQSSSFEGDSENTPVHILRPPPPPVPPKPHGNLPALNVQVIPQCPGSSRNVQFTGQDRETPVHSSNV